MVVCRMYDVPASGSQNNGVEHNTPPPCCITIRDVNLGTGQAKNHSIKSMFSLFIV